MVEHLKGVTPIGHGIVEMIGWSRFDRLEQFLGQASSPGRAGVHHASGRSGSADRRSSMARWSK